MRAPRSWATENTCWSIGRCGSFSILSDGERSIVPPFVGGGASPYGLVVTSAGVFGQPGTLRAYLRWMPRTNAYPGLKGGL